MVLTRSDMEELDSRFSKMMETMLQPMREDNQRLSRENKMLREVNNQLLNRIDKLLTASASPAQHDTAELCHTTSSHNELHHDDFGDIQHQGNETLILSDSILRHVGSSCPKKPGFAGPVLDSFCLDPATEYHHVHKVVVPGARCSRLWPEAVKASIEHPNCSNIIVCVGANYTQMFTPSQAVREIEEFLTAVSELFPDARVAWTVTLPQFDHGPVLGGIRYANDAIFDFCIENDIDIIYAPEFSLYANEVNSVRKLFAIDGIHMNKAGITAMTNVIRDYIIFQFMH